MKRLLLLPAIAILLSVASCKKSDGNDDSTSTNKFKLGTKTYLIDHITTDTNLVQIKAYDNAGSGIGVGFDDYFPTVSGTYNVVNSPNDSNEIQIFAFTDYAAHRWEGVESFGAQTVEVTVTAGKIKVDIADINLYSPTGDMPIVANIALKQK